MAAIRKPKTFVLAVGLAVAIGAFFTGPSRSAVQTRSGFKSGIGRIRASGERRGVSAGRAGQWTYAHRRGLRIGAVALAALVLVFWDEPTGLVVIVLVVIVLVVLGLIELIGRPRRNPRPRVRPDPRSARAISGTVGTERTGS